MVFTRGTISQKNYISNNFRSPLNDFVMAAHNVTWKNDFTGFQFVTRLLATI